MDRAELAEAQVERFAQQVVRLLPEYLNGVRMSVVVSAKQILEIGAKRWIEEHSKEVSDWRLYFPDIGKINGPIA